jgi:Putative restriction endonuclease
MSTLSPRRPRTAPNGIPPLENGERMTQPEFHKRYLACPEDEKWELIGGIVYNMTSPLSLTHSDYDGEVGYALETYRRATPGVHVLHNATTILGEESEPQPDLGMRILPDFGGRSRTSAEDYLQGPPELLVELAHSRRAIAMHAKRDDYERAGVIEYLVVCAEEQELHWFDFSTGQPVTPNRQGVLRSRVFPGLWIDGAALLRCDSARITEVVRQGLASREHAAFVRRLRAAHRKR